ncbi:DUF74-domain-containing protein [Exidia glandulosa HHB12029]|uniref:DUF74-domain-containing protein n=1 Tax=Exidia glandulosa HHB12029 TaxID=1314781 RepID=A0A165BMB5_EXIGL|nr:DUF74-domain-containing protein [Exidia glandulosa HHB12029]
MSSSDASKEASAAGTFNTGHPEVLVTTMNDIPGYEVLEIYGTIFGITVRSRNVFANIGAGLKSLVGGELKALSRNIETARVSAVDRLVGHAMGLHANANSSLNVSVPVIAMRFDTSNGGADGNQIAVTAYGTACRIRKLDAPPATAPKA